MPVELVGEYERELYEEMSNLHEADVLEPVRTTGALSDETKAALDKALTEFTAAFLKTHA